MSPPTGGTATVKKSRLGSVFMPVPQTDTGGQVEETKVNEGPSVKELGKLTP